MRTLLKADDGSKIDDVVTRTGFRKTQFGEGKFLLNDRAIMMHGYAQCTSNEWPGVGMSVPAWLSDYSNKLMVESGGNLVRWMHVCPWKQDIESCDRVGLLQAMPAEDAEKDVDGRRCPIDNRTIHFNYQGELEWLGGIATPNEETQKKLADKKQSLVVNKNETAEQKAARKAADILDSTDSDNTFDNYVGSIDLPVECGVNRVLVRSTANPGNIKIFAGADGIKGVAEIDLNTEKVDIAYYLPQHTLRGDLSRGETPSTPSYTDIKETLDIVEVVAGSNQEDAKKTFDDDETTEWKSDGNPKNAWITYQLAKKDVVNKITVKLTGWRDKMYPLAIYAGKKKIWEGYTYVYLGYVHINIDKPVKAKELTIKMIGDAKSKTQLGDTKELAGGKASTLDFIGITKGKPVLRIVEIDLLKNK